MTLVRCNPRSELERVFGDPFFRQFFDLESGDELLGGGERRWYPSMDLVEKPDRLLARLELPGVDPKNVHINLQGDTLVVQGERQAENEDDKSKYLKREHIYGSFQRTVRLPYRVQADKVKAHYRNGVMTIELPKAEEHVGRQIPVEIEV